MAQQNIPNGLALGAPGPIGSAMIYVFGDAGYPNTRSDPNGQLAGAQLGSLFLQTDSPALWQKTAASVPGASPTGTWTAIT